MSNLVDACRRIAEDAEAERARAIEDDYGVPNRRVLAAWTFGILGLFVVWCVVLTAIAKWIVGGQG